LNVSRVYSRKETELIIGKLKTSVPFNSIPTSHQSIQQETDNIIYRFIGVLFIDTSFGFILKTAIASRTSIEGTFALSSSLLAIAILSASVSAQLAFLLASQPKSCTTLI
jgi:hypothetical protein